MEHTDEELLQGVALGHGDSMAAFYRRHIASVLAFLLRETGDRELAADLAAEVFAAVLRSASSYRTDARGALPWLLGIARNKLRMSRRRGRVEARARRRLGLEPVALDDADLEAVESLASDGTVALLAALPEGERVAVREHVLGGRPYGEIAAQLECSELVVRKRVSRGLARLREQLEEGGR